MCQQAKMLSDFYKIVIKILYLFKIYFFCFIYILSTGSVYATSLIFKCVLGKQKCYPNFFSPSRIHGGLKKFKFVKFIDCINISINHQRLCCWFDFEMCARKAEILPNFFFNPPKIHGGLEKIQTLDARQS